jgi:sortase A
MTAIETFDSSAPTEPDLTTDPWQSYSESPAEVEASAVPPLSPRMQFIRAPIVMLLVLSATLFIHIVLLSRPQESASQQRAFDHFRSQLATGTAPIGPTDSDNRLLSIGTSVAYLEIPDIGVKQVVGEGTTPGALFKGPGHRRDTPLPGQVGTSVLFGRRAAFGGPFARIDELHKGDLITVTTGQGIFKFHVLGVRKAGDPNPAAIASGAARLVLITAAGTPFLPSGVIRVDADLDGVAAVGPARLVSFSALPREERLMASDTRTLWTLALWLQALIVMSLAAVWVWQRWGRAQAWVIFLPALVLVGMFASGEAAHLLPNLL